MADDDKPALRFGSTKVENPDDFHEIQTVASFATAGLPEYVQREVAEKGLHPHVTFGILAEAMACLVIGTATHARHLRGDGTEISYPSAVASTFLNCLMRVKELTGMPDAEFEEILRATEAGMGHLLENHKLVGAMFENGVPN